MPASPNNHHDRDDRDDRDVLQVTARELRDTIRVTIDRELIDTLDAQRQGLSRSQYLELVLRAALQRQHPHLPEHWTPERSAQERYARVRRYLQTGH
jgi:hypothetical protein